MPINMTNGDALVTAIGVLTGRIDAIAAATAGVSSSISVLKNLDQDIDFPSALRDAVDKTYELGSLVNDGMINEIEAVSVAAHAFFADVMVNYVEDGCEINEDGLHKVHGTLPTNSLHQWRYLNPHLFADMVHRATNANEVVSTVLVDACCMDAPEDMYAESILKRTTFYVRELMNSEDYSWLEDAICIASDFALKGKTEVLPVYQNLRDALENPALKEAAIRALGDESIRVPYMTSIQNMADACVIFTQFANTILGMCGIYTDLYKALKDTAEAIDAAYKIYKQEACVTTF